MSVRSQHPHQRGRPPLRGVVAPLVAPLRKSLGASLRPGGLLVAGKHKTPTKPLISLCLWVSGSVKGGRNKMDFGTCRGRCQNPFCPFTGSESHIQSTSGVCGGCGGGKFGAQSNVLTVLSGGLVLPPNFPGKNTTGSLKNLPMVDFPGARATDLVRWAGRLRGPCNRHMRGGLAAAGPACHARAATGGRNEGPRHHNICRTNSYDALRHM